MKQRILCPGAGTSGAAGGGPRLLSARSNRARGPGGAGGRKGRCGPARRRPRGGRCCPGRGGWGLQGGPAQQGLAFLQGRRDGKEWDIPGLGWGPAESGSFASDLNVSSHPGSLARSWSAPYAGHLWSHSASYTGALLWAAILSPQMPQPSSFMADSWSFQLCPEDPKCAPWMSLGCAPAELQFLQLEAVTLKVYERE